MSRQALDGKWINICNFLESLVGDSVPIKIADLEVLVAALTRDSNSFCRFCTSPLPKSIGFDINDDKFADVGQELLDLSPAFRKLRYELVRPRRLNDNDFFSRFFHGLQEQLRQIAIDKVAENSSDTIGSHPCENPVDSIDEIEYTLLNIPRCAAFSVTAPSSASEHHAHEWKQAIWQGRCRVVGKGSFLSINLVDPRSDEFFARCVIPNGEHEKYVQATADSSCHFVLKIPNGPLHYFLGFGFEDRADAFSFRSCLVDFKAGLGTPSDELPATNENLPAIPTHDLSMKQGETITVNLKGKSAHRDRKAQAIDSNDVSTSTALAPPPPPDSSIIGHRNLQPKNTSFADDDTDDFGGFQSADIMASLEFVDCLEDKSKRENLSASLTPNTSETRGTDLCISVEKVADAIDAGDQEADAVEVSEPGAQDKVKMHESQYTSIPLEDATFHSVDRKTFSLQTGVTFSQSLTWPREARSDDFHWKVFVLDELTVDLEVRALLRPCDDAQPAKDIILQRNARGGTFMGKLRPTRDKRLLPTKEVTATHGVNGHLEVDSIVFNFSNKFSWFSPKNVEIVTVFESKHTASAMA